MKLRFSEQAIRDRRRLAAFLAEDNPHAAMRALEAIRTALSALAHAPFMGRQLENQRKLYVRFCDSGYVIQYRVDADAVVIARTFHAREER